MNEVYVPERARQRVRRAGLGLGFTQLGFAPASTPPNADAYLRWVERGWHGEMEYMARGDAVARRIDPEAALHGCRTVVVVSLAYGPPSEPPAQATDLPRAILARYAAERDYHEVFEEKLAELEGVVMSEVPSANTKPYVDYGPVLERDHAQRAGLGWVGKNTMLIHPRMGSWLMLGEILTTAAFRPDDPFLPDHCGTCDRCIQACPTGAIRAARELDARLCISYLTIELRGSIPVALRPAIGRRVFGCDICQDVCPWNSDPHPGDLTPFGPGRPWAPTSMAEWALAVAGLSDDEYRGRYRGTPLDRPGRAGMLRNLCVGLGNSGGEVSGAERAGMMNVLRVCLEDRSSIVAEHAAWALRRLGAPGTPD